MRYLLALTVLLSTLFFSCRNTAEQEEQQFVTDRSQMPRQTIPAWPAGMVKDTCIDISGGLLTGSVAVRNDALGTHCVFTAGRGSHNVYDSMGFEMDRLEHSGRHYSYFYLYDAQRKLLYKIGMRSRKGVVSYDTTITAYAGADRTFALSKADGGKIAVVTTLYNNRRQVVKEYNQYYYPDLRRAPAGANSLYINNFYYTEENLDSLVALVPQGKPPYAKMKLVYKGNGYPATAQVGATMLPHPFVVMPCKDTSVFMHN